LLEALPMTLRKNAQSFAFSTALLASLGTLAAFAPAAHAQSAPELPAPSASVAPESAPPAAASSVQTAPISTTPLGAPSVAAVPAPSAAPAEAEELARLRALAVRGASPLADARWAVGLAGLGVSAVATPVGAVMMGRERGSFGAAITLGTGIGAGVGGLLVLSGVFANLDPYSDVTAAIQREKNAGKSDAVALAAGEKAFENAAREARTARRASGIVSLSLGIAGLGAGAVAGLADFTTSRFSRKDQDGVAAAITIYGMLATVSGVGLLFSDTPVESAWNGYSAGKGLKRSSALRLTGFGASPLPEGGATMGLGGTF
jgi:hypothetical protein